jgi:Fe-S cluster biogenesis protein NfuA
MKEKILKALEDVRPSLQMDGGDVEFVGFDQDSGVLTVRLMGMCSHCPMSQITLKQGIEEHVKTLVPEVKSVISA